MMGSRLGRVATVLLLVLVLVPVQAPAFAVGSKVVSSSVATTLTLHGNGAPTNFNTSFGPPSGATVSSASLSIETPSDPSLAPTNISVSLESGAEFWGWPTSFGTTYGFTGASNLQASNGSGTGVIRLPSGALVTSGSIFLSALGRPLSGNYSVALQLGTSSVFARSGLQEFSTFAPVSWGSQSSDITAIAAGTNPNGSTDVVVGTLAGELAVYQVTPGSAPIAVYEQDLSPGLPINAVALGQLAPYQALSFVAASAGIVFILNLTATGQWRETALELPSENNGHVAIASKLAISIGPSGLPTVFAMTGGGSLDYTEFGSGGPAGGWDNPLFRYLVSPWSGPQAFGAWTAPNGSALLAVGGSGGLEVLGFPGNPAVPLANLSISSGTVQDLVFDPSGAWLYAATSSGQLIRFPSTWVGPPTELNISDTPILRVVVGQSAGGFTRLIALTASHAVLAINPSAWSTSLPVLIGNFSTANSVGELAIGSVLGIGEGDVLLTQGTGVDLAGDTSVFTGTTIASWGSELSQQISGLPSSLDAQGNPWVSVPATLTVSGGLAEATYSLVQYNLTRTLDITPVLPRPITGGSPQGSNLQLSFSSGSPGVVHVEVTLDWLVQEPPSAFARLSSVFSGNAIWVAIPVACAGGLFLGLGRLGYWRPGRRRGPGGG